MKKCKTCKQNLHLNRFEKNRAVCYDCRRLSKSKHLIVCGHCLKEFNSDKKDRVFCGSACSGLARRIKVVVTCSNCERPKEVVPSVKERLERFYCDQECRTEHLKEIMRGERNPNFSRVVKECDGCGTNISIHPHVLKRLRHNFCSYNCYRNNIGRFYKGENNNNWNHEISEEERLIKRRYPAYYDWRNEVFERDNYTCQCCGDPRGGNLNAHHIENYSTAKEKRTNLENGITLCKECHTLYHKTYGYSNNNKMQLQKFMKNTKDALA